MSGEARARAAYEAYVGGSAGAARWSELTEEARAKWRAAASAASSTPAERSEPRVAERSDGRVARFDGGRG